MLSMASPPAYEDRTPPPYDNIPPPAYDDIPPPPDDIARQLYKLCVVDVVRRLQGAGCTVEVTPHPHEGLDAILVIHFGVVYHASICMSREGDASLLVEEASGMRLMSLEEFC